MKKKTMLALFLAAVLVFGMLAGCGSTTGSSAAPAAESSSAQAESPEPAEVPAAEEQEPSVEPEEANDAPEADFDIYGPFSEETITLTYWKLWPPFLEGYDPMEASLFATFYEDLNVKVDVTTIGTDSADTKFNLMVASGDYLDMIENATNSYSGGGTKAIADEVLIDLMPYMETYAPDYWAALQKDEIGMKKMINADNQMASIVSLFDEMPVPQSGLWIRTDWLKEQNLDKPSTLEDLDNVLSVFKEQYNCSDPFALREDCALPFRNVFGANEWTVDDNGNVNYGYTDNRDAFKEYLKTGHEWYEKGYFSSEFVTSNDTNNPKSEMIVNGSAGVIDADVLIISEVGVLDNSVELEAVAPITKNTGDKLAPDWDSAMNDSNQASISTNCTIPEIAVAYINYAFTEQAFMAVNWGIEGKTYTMENGEPVFTDLMLNNPALPASFTPLAYISPGFPMLKSYQMALSSYNHPAQQGCYEIFASKTDNSLPKTNYPSNYVTFTTEESDTMAQYQADIETYVTECLSKFITGDMDVDKDYDAFADQLEAMGSGEIKDVYQAAYARFIG